MVRSWRWAPESAPGTWSSWVKASTRFLHSETSSDGRHEGAATVALTQSRTPAFQFELIDWRVLDQVFQTHAQRCTRKPLSLLSIQIDGAR